MGLKKKNEARLSKMQVTFLKTHTPIHNKEEIKKIYKKHLKECPDNKITKKVFQELYKEFYPHRNGAHFSHIVFKTLDPKGDQGYGSDTCL